ncbi:hypothetical protein PLANPX_4936 [Lacipirellula parvula]|uniref:Uncharacterized protein n=1 Tax=Lacipirellula parvula TaxID=2650471 RepID=A0A5K7XEM9_9BACT|nr:hypothetical protein PLANPX_4936 [Lacipirellula parvula]
MAPLARSKIASELNLTFKRGVRGEPAIPLLWRRGFLSRHLVFGDTKPKWLRALGLA